MKKAAKSIENEYLLGFDTETKPSFIKGQKLNPISLIQLASEKCVYLFRICKLENHSFGPLKSILEDPKIVKSGIGIKDDLRQLKSIMDFNPAGF